MALRTPPRVGKEAKGQPALARAGRTRGQAGLEFMQAIILLVALFVIITPFIYIKYSDNLNAQLRADGQLIAETVAGEINTAAGVGEGYRRIFELPALLSEKEPYTVELAPKEQLVYVVWGNGFTASAQISTAQVTVPKPIAPGGHNVVYNNAGTLEVGEE